MAFDPCREWLGIDAIDLADPRLVLGVPPDAHDADLIARAAAARLEALQRVSPGPFAKAHTALVARVEEARDKLLAQAPAAAALPPPVPTPSGFRAAPVPAAVAPASASPTEIPEPQAAADAPFSLPGPRSLRAALPRRRSSGGGLVLGAIALLGAAAAVLAVFVFRDARQVAAGPARPVDRAAANRASAGSAGSSAEPVDDESVDRPRRQRNREPRAAEVAKPRDVEAEERRLEGEAEQAPTAIDAEARRAAEERTAAEARMRADRERQQAEADRRRAEQEQATMSAALDKSLTEAYVAIQRQEFDTALRAITAAEKNVGDDVDAATRVERWRLFAAYAKEFFAYQAQAFAAANSGREFEADGVRFSVIEIKPDLFVYKVAGRIERVSRKTVDRRIEMAVVDHWFAADGRAANHLFLGARWLSFDPPDVQRARREWQIAGDGGETVAPLMVLLDDPVIRRAGR